ncbi:MAG: hypothetical protein V3U29_09650, partial [Phycisphaeraceae bacterium]
MAQIGHVYQVETTDQTHTGDLVYNTKFTVLGSAFAASTEYIMFVQAQVGGSSANARFKFRTQIGGTTPEGSEMIMEPANNAGPRRASYVFLHKFTTLATPEDVTFQIAPHQNTGDTARADSIVLLALSLDDLAATDWSYGEDLTDADHATASTFKDHASITFTPGTTGEDWLIIGWGSVHINHTGKQWRYRISRDADAEVEPLHSQEGEDAADEWPWILMRPFNLDNTEHTFKVQSNDDSAGGAENQHNISKIFALRLQAFEDVVTFWDGGTFDTPSTGYNEIVDLAFTATTTGKGVVLGTCCAIFTSGVIAAVRAQIGGTTEPIGEDSNWDADSYDTTDIRFMPVLARYDVTASTTADVDIDVNVGDAATDIADRGFAAFSLELTAAGGVFDESAAITADGTLAAAADAVFEPAASVAADGTVTAAADATLEPGAALGADAQLAAQAGLELDDSAALAGDGTLASVVDVDFAPSAELAAGGELAAAVDVAFGPSADIAADGKLSAAAGLVAEPGIALLAGAILTAAAEVIGAASDAQGTLSLSGVHCTPLLASVLSVGAAIQAA